VNGCVDALDAVAQECRGALDPERAAGLARHVQGCARCRQAREDALACAPGLGAAGAAPAGPADPVGWERGLFLRLLGDERGRAAGRPRSPGWGRLALRLGSRTKSEVRGEWARWKRDAAGGASP